MGREIRLRGLSGVIMLDAIRMENTTARDAVLDRIKASVDGLEPPVKVLGWTRGGLIEMTRDAGRRACGNGSGWGARLGADLPLGAAGPFGPWSVTLSFGCEGSRTLSLRCGPEVAGWIMGEAGVWARLQTALGAEPRIETVPDWPLSRYEILPDGRKQRGIDV